MIVKSCIVICIVLFAFDGQAARADEDGSLRTVQVSGVGKSTAIPDMATIQTGVVTQSEMAADALKQNSEIIEKLMAQLKNLNVAERDIQTSQFNVTPEYERGPRGERLSKITGYRVTNQLRIRVRKLPELGKLLDQLIQSGSNQISGISFGVDDQAEAMNQARIKAMGDSKARARLYAKAAGLAVGRVLTISEQQVVFPRPNFIARGMEARSAAVPVAAGEQEFSATINVTFELVDNR